IGNFISTVDFDPGAGKFNLTSNGDYDIVICKFDKDGKFLWAKSFGGPSIETAWSFDIDDAGNYYCAGSYFGSVDFDPGPIANIHFGTASNNTFLCKYSTNGDLIWVYDLFCTNISIPNYLIVDHCNDINLFGVYIDTLDFKSKNGVKRLTSFGKFDSYFVRLDSSGNFMQFKGLGNNSNDWVVSVDIDNLNNMYIAGYFSDTINFNNNVIENYHFSLGDYNTFILQLVSCNSQSRHDTIEACDQYTWIDGSTYYHSTDTITYNESNSSCCKVLSKLNLTINKSDTNLIALKGCDSLVINYYKYFESGFYNIISKNVKGCDSITNLKLEIKKSDFIPLNVTTCDSFIWHNTTYQKSGIFNKKFINVHGCDSIETLQLKLNSSSQSSSSIQVCDSYTWNGNTYNTTGNYSYKTQNSFGCDSIANLQLTIFPSHSIQLKVSACDSYTWNGNVYTNSGTYTFNGKNENGCDSIVFLNLIIDTFLYSNEFISSCDQYVWNGKSYNTTGQYRDTFSSINGCDSIVTLNLALNQSKSFIQTQTACDSLLWLGKNYKQSGLYYDTLSTTKGCDSIIKLDLTIHSTKNIKQQKTACDSLEWNGSTYKQSGIYISKNQSQHSCDSITELELTIHPSTRTILMHSACDSFEWNRNVIKQSGIYTQILSNQYSCDSLVTLHIEIFPSTRILDTVHACEEYIDPITGNRITKDEVLSFNQQTEHGCDSVINKVVYIHPQYFYSDTVYTQQNYHWSINNQNYGESGIYTANFQTKEQCDSIYTLYLIIEDDIEIYAPNVIHPGSGIATNKYFYLITSGEIDQIQELKIYDRWGELVWEKTQFQANIPELGWDGTFKSQMVNPGVFVWLAIVRLKDGREIKVTGDFTVLR
ncbi:MAG: gliding motility-associated C-terminal domain-containing protein, partial [Saprospiraceae bacterium]|nr:gliding motility-associated C-terminal domain-containing protein [Saprospiraceae bacterium]